jgi:hypothetical protein
MKRLHRLNMSGAAFIAVVLLVIALYYPVCSIAAQDPSVEDLQQQIKTRDATIADLARRVEALEQKLAGTKADQVTKIATDTTKPSDDTAPAEEEITRALERTLVREGGLVLPRWSIEAEPRFTYTYHGSNALQIVQLNGQTEVVQQNAKHDTFESSASLRLGLPWTSQVDLRIPYLFDRQELATDSTTVKTRRHSGLGDIELGLTKQLLQEKDWIPDLLTSLGWKSNTGNTGLGSGFHTVQASLTGVKRRDPLAFFGTFFYNWSLSGRQAGNNVDLGNTIGLRMGTILATSPDTSFRFALDLNRSGKLELNRRKIPGSNTTVALFEFGLATVITPRTLFDIRASIGLTSDSPDFRLALAVPIRLY